MPPAPHNKIKARSSMEDNVHSIEVYLHPVAAFAIVDSHERRSKDNQTRVIGSLLGTKTPDGVYEVLH